MAIELEGTRRTPDEDVVKAGVTVADTTPLPSSKTTTQTGDDLIVNLGWQTGIRVLTRPGGWSGSGTQRSTGAYAALAAQSVMWKTGGVPGSESADGGSFDSSTTWSSLYEAYRAMPAGTNTSIGGVKKQSEIDSIMVGGVRKTVRGRYVIIGGVKKNVS